MSDATSAQAPDRFAAARAVADAVLYEGYVLYPYRASSAKNQLRWQFGVLAPRAFSEADGSERWSTRTECLVDAAKDPRLHVRIRCLQVQSRSVERFVAGNGAGADGSFAPVGSLEVGGDLYVEWDEAVDRVVDLPELQLAALEAAAYDAPFQLPGGSEVETVHEAGGEVAGRIVRTRRAVDGFAHVEASRMPGPASLVKVSVTVENRTKWAGGAARRAEVMGSALVAVHTMLAVDGGRFVSLLDPPADARDAVARCHSDGSFPVLVGGGEVVLSSPIILYDCPEVAPESPGDLYDATEIDEILALRVLTLTEEEKHEARGTDARAAAIIDRCDSMSPELWDRLHGAVRSLGPDPAPAVGLGEPGGAPWWDPASDSSVDPWTDSLVVAGREVKKGTAVRLNPSHRADAQDLFLRGMTATVAGIFSDVDGSAHVAVSIDDDPANSELAWQGRYLFFHPDEVEPLPAKDPAR